MNSVYDFADYREFLTVYLQLRAQKERGIQSKFAKACGISTTMASLILKGDKHLNLEQAAEAIEFIGLNDRESEYFFLLVEIGKAGTHKLKQILKMRQKEMQAQAKKLSKRIKVDKELPDEIMAIYYSSWVFTAINNLCAIDGYNDVNSIAKRLSLPSSQVANAVEFLVQNGMCKIVNGRITYGPAHTHVGNDSPFVIKHLQNWRIKALNNIDAKNDKNLFYTSPYSLSAEAVEEIRKLLPNLIQEVLKIVGPSTSEKLYCLNLDWFEV